MTSMDARAPSAGPVRVARQLPPPPDCAPLHSERARVLRRRPKLSMDILPYSPGCTPSATDPTLYVDGD